MSSPLETPPRCRLRYCAASEARGLSGRVFACVVNGVVDAGAEGCCCGHSAADFNGLDGLQAHDRPGKLAVEALIPIGVGAEAGRNAWATTSKMPFTVSPALDGHPLRLS